GRNHALGCSGFHPGHVPVLDGRRGNQRVAGELATWWAARPTGRAAHLLTAPRVRDEDDDNDNRTGSDALETPTKIRPAFRGRHGHATRGLGADHSLPVVLRGH